MKLDGCPGEEGETWRLSVWLLLAVVELLELAVVGTGPRPSNALRRVSKERNEHTGCKIRILFKDERSGSRDSGLGKLLRIAGVIKARARMVGCFGGRALSIPFS